MLDRYTRETELLACGRSTVHRLGNEGIAGTLIRIRQGYCAESGNVERVAGTSNRREWSKGKKTMLWGNALRSPTSCRSSRVVKQTKHPASTLHEGIGVEAYPWMRMRLLEQVLLDDREPGVLVEPFALLTVLRPEAVFDVLVRDARKLLQHRVSPAPSPLLHRASSNGGCSQIAGSRPPSGAPKRLRSPPARWRCAS